MSGFVAGVAGAAIYILAGYGLGAFLERGNYGHRDVDASSFYGGWVASMAVLSGLAVIVIWLAS